MARRAAIVGTGMQTGARRVTNDEIAEVLDSSDEWIQRRTGIKARHFVTPGQSNTDMSRAAALDALHAAGLKPDQLDAIIFATLSPDIAFPGTGMLLQRALGLDTIPALDVRNQCSGFLYGLSVADAWIRAGVYHRVLLVGSEIHSTGLNLSREGRDVAVLFGDGAGAVVLEAVEADDQRAGQLLDLTIGADGSGAELLTVQRPGSQFHPRICVEDIKAGRHFPVMEGRQVFRRAIEILTREIEDTLTRLDLERDEIVLIPHQSNRRINEMVAQRLGIASDKVVHTIDEYGNTTAASIPMALHQGLKRGLIQPGDVVVMAAFGSGLSWGTAALQW